MDLSITHIDIDFFIDIRVEFIPLIGESMIVLGVFEYSGVVGDHHCPAALVPLDTPPGGATAPIPGLVKPIVEEQQTLVTHPIFYQNYF